MKLKHSESALENLLQCVAKNRENFVRDAFELKASINNFLRSINNVTDVAVVTKSTVLDAAYELASLIKRLSGISSFVIPSFSRYIHLLQSDKTDLSSMQKSLLKCAITIFNKQQVIREDYLQYLYTAPVDSFSQPGIFDSAPYFQAVIDKQKRTSENVSTLSEINVQALKEKKFGSNNSLASLADTAPLSSDSDSKKSYSPLAFFNSPRAENKTYFKSFTFSN